MTLEPGARLGPYQIVDSIGAGGMGEVYRARDTRLGREVAVKTLPPGMASDPERRVRFEQEARAASSLNHPNIISILDIGDEGGVSYIAMEHVEGKTLRELLASGPLTTRKALDLSVQLAEGLAKAHAAGILHRDLKPENLIVSKDGFLKILDFGLAKLVEPLGENVAESPTVTRPGTTPGAVLGTVGYMSPEQASGQPVEFRSDQFSLGTILYELVTGCRAFQRKTGAETLAAIIREDPEPISRRSPSTPAPLRWIIERCLAKDPDDRFASTRDLARDLASVRDHLSETSVSSEAPAAGARRRRGYAAVLLLVAGLGAGFALGALAFRLTAPVASDVRFRRLTFRRGTVLSARFAPDGQTVVYGAAWEGRPPEVFSVRFDSPESRSLGLPPADLLSISSTGEMALSLGRRYIFGWESTGTLARAPLGGGVAPREVLEKVQEADWSPDGRQLAVVRDAGERRRLEFPMGTVLYETPGWISDARVSPDGERVAFFAHPERGDNIGDIVVADVRGSRRTLVPNTASNGLACSPDGREVWSAGINAVDLQGRVRRLLAVPGATLLHDVSRDGGVLVARSNWQREIVGRGPGGAAERNLSWLDWSYPRDLSDDGTTVLLEEQNIGSGTQYAIYLRNTDGSPAVRLGSGRALALSPDGKWALASSGSGDASELILMPTGAGQPQTILKGAGTYESASWFPDSRRVLVSGSEPRHASRLYVVELEGGRKTAISPEGVTVYHWRALSPDGRLAVAQAADRTIWLYPLAGGDPRPLPGTTKEDVPIRWAADSRSLYVQSVAAVPVRVDIIDVTTGARRPWKELTPTDPAGIVTVGPIRLSADGRSYVYSYRRVIDDLYVVEGLR